MVLKGFTNQRFSIFKVYFELLNVLYIKGMYTENSKTQFPILKDEIWTSEEFIIQN